MFGSIIARIKPFFVNYHFCSLFPALPLSAPTIPAPTITMAVSESPTSINLAWTQPGDEVVDSYEVSFSYQGPCSGFNHTNTTTVDGTTRQYTLTGLQEFSNYTVTVVAVNGAGRSEESILNVVTLANGMCVRSIMFLKADTMMNYNTT